MSLDNQHGAVGGRLRLALCALLATAGLLIMPAVIVAADVPRLVAGEPIILDHPKINKSVGNPVHCLTFVEDGALLATGATSGVLVWDVKTGKLRQTLEVDERAVDSIALDPAGNVLVAGGASGVIKIFDARTFQLLRTLGPTPGAVRGLAISPDGKLLATAGPNGGLEDDEDFGIFLWDLAKGDQLRKLPHARPRYGATALVFSSDGRQLITAQDRTFRVFDVQDANEVKTIEAPDLPRTIGSIALAQDGRRLATGVFEPKIRLWDTHSWKQQFAWDAHDDEPPPRSGVASVNFSPDGRFVLTGGLDGMACVWDAATGRRLLKLDARGEASARWITGMAMTPDNRRLAASHYGGTATIWTVAEHK